MLARLLLLLLCLYPAWLALLALHEAGHVLHAWLSGGVVERVHLPLIGFSHTQFASNPRPLFVAWGGVIWGAGLPLAGVLALWAALRPARPSGAAGRLCRAALAFAGLCMVVNGAYIGTAPILAVGDAQDLVRLGVPAWLLGLGGALLCAGGVAALAAARDGRRACGLFGRARDCGQSVGRVARPGAHAPRQDSPAHGDAPVPADDVAECFCPNCGYNLRGLPRPVCPECGRDVSALLSERSLIPWVNATRWNAPVAFWRTAVLLLLQPRWFCCEVVRPVDWRVARRFAWMAAAQAWLSAPLTMVGLVASGQWRARAIFELFPLWLWGVFLVGWLLLWFGLGGIQTYWFQPRAVADELRRRTLALSWYAAGGWALGMFCWPVAWVVAHQLPRTPQHLAMSLPILCAMALLAAIPAIVWWWATVRLSVCLYRSVQRAVWTGVAIVLFGWLFVAVWLLFLIGLPFLLATAIESL